MLFALKAYFVCYQDNISYTSFFWLDFAWYFLFHPFTFIFLCPYLDVFYMQYILFNIWSENFYLLVLVFSPKTFNVIMDLLGLVGTILLLLSLCPISFMFHFPSYISFFWVDQTDELSYFYFQLFYFPLFQICFSQFCILFPFFGLKCLA